MLKKKVISIIGLVFIVGIVVAVVTSSDFLVMLGKVVGITSKSIGDDYALQQSIEPIGAEKMTSEDYELRSDIGSDINSKIENDLTKVYCYPSPYKPSLGHTEIKFSHLTSYTNLRVFNIAGELVYRDEQDTSNGELSWAVVNNNGNKLASGVYIYLITDNDGHKAKGKFAVIK
ncbi:MAG: gliding motility-associated C-terminal domain-containing protein [Elusimicrobiota bacterium]